jgi:PAS domain S-box-containing protein
MLGYMEITENIGKEANNLRLENCQLAERLSIAEAKILALEEENSLLKHHSEDLRLLAAQELAGFTISKSGRYSYVSSGFCAITGYSPSDMLGEGPSAIGSFVHPADEGKFRSFAAAGGSETGTASATFRLRTSKGLYKCIFAKSCNVKLNGANSTTAVYIDVTEKSEKLNQLKESHKLFTSIFNNSPAGLLFADTSGRIIEANPKIGQITGFSTESLIGTANIYDPGFIPDAVFSEKFKLCVEMQAPEEGSASYTRRCGKQLYIDYLIDPVRSGTGHFEGCLISIIDVTARVLSDNSLKESEEKLQKIFQSSPNAIAVINRRGYVTACNEMQAKLLGFADKKELIGRHASTVAGLSAYLSAKKELVRPAIGAHKFSGLECKLVRPDGSIFDAEISGAAVKSGSGASQCAVIVSQDISKRKFYEQEIVRAKEAAIESDMLKSSFLENMSHEIRTPINGIVGFLDIICSDEASPAEKKEYAAIVQQSAYKLLSSIDDIMDASKLHLGQMPVHITGFSYKETIAQLCGKYRRQAGPQSPAITYTDLSPSCEGIISTDKHKLEQVLSKLLDNALKFCPTGQIKLYTQNCPSSGIVFTVEDTGIGISEENLPLVFEKFRQLQAGLSRQYGGNGLGLSLSKDLIELLGGRIWAESVLGKGSLFHFSLPLGADCP